MSNSMQDLGAKSAPFLRVFYGDETDAPKGAAQSAHDHLSADTIKQTEAFWAGRTPATRISTRIAA